MSAKIVNERLAWYDTFLKDRGLGRIGVVGVMAPTEAKAIERVLEELQSDSKVKFDVSPSHVGVDETAATAMPEADAQRMSEEHTPDDIVHQYTMIIKA